MRCEWHQWWRTDKWKPPRFIFRWIGTTDAHFLFLVLTIVSVWIFVCVLLCFSELLHRGVPLPDIASRSGSPNLLLGPSPPSTATAAAGYPKLPGIRARRLQQRNANRHYVPLSSCLPETLKAEEASAETDMAIKQVQQLVHIPHPPPPITQTKEQMDPWWAVIEY